MRHAVVFCFENMVTSVVDSQVFISRFIFTLTFR